MSQLKIAYEIARTQIGVKEIPGPKHAAKIVEYHRATTLKALTDEVPWCSAFVNWCIIVAGYMISREAMERLLVEHDYSYTDLSYFSGAAMGLRDQISLSTLAGAALDSPILPTRSALARHFLLWGVDKETPEPGDLVILKRSGSPLAGHVGFYVSQNAFTYRLLGGNQNNQVSELNYLKLSLLGFRGLTSAGAKLV